MISENDIFMLRYFCGYFIKENRNKLLTLLSSRTIISNFSWVFTFVFSIVFSLIRNVILIIWLLIVIIVIAMYHTWSFFVIFNVIIRRVIILRCLPFSFSTTHLISWRKSSSRMLTLVRVM